MCAPCCGCEEDVEQVEAHGWSQEHQGLGIISSFRVAWRAVFAPSCCFGLMRSTL
uniref:Aprl6 n=1 Tax=Arundo donax TaxID=35708 RepID=A0A0A9FWW5_ARUDO